LRRVEAAGVATGGVGIGAPAALGLLVLTESGVPVLIPADVLLLLVGERAAAGAIPLAVVVAALVGIAVGGTTILFLLARGPGRALVDRLGPRIGITARRLDRASVLLERRGLPALAIGRATPGLRTVTVVSAGSSRLPAGRALPALFIGAIVFHLGHLVLGYLLGPLAWAAIESARGPALAVLAALVVVAAVVWFRRRGRRAGAQAFTEGICPACLAADWLAERPAKADGHPLTHRGG
jgi:membrane protein DedA with SNARE-associated domain